MLTGPDALEVRVTEWFYKVTPVKAGFDDTRRLAKRDGFLWRSAHDKDERLTPDVGGPALGDTLHVYFLEKHRGPRPLGSFVLVAAEKHPEPGRFGEPVPATALFRVKDSGFASQLSAFDDYSVDPVLKEFTGWLLAPAAGTPPPFEQTPLKGAGAKLRKR
jgi:hypothetical protein